MADIKATIRALLNKASGTDNPHEAQAFYTKAHELMVRFNIEEDALGTPSDLVRGTEYFDCTEKWIWLLSHSAARLIGCSVLVSDHVGAYFAGRPTNVQMTEELFAHYAAQVNRYYKLALPKGMSKADRSVFRRNFKEGAVQVIWWRVNEIVAANTRALIVSPLQLEKEIEELTGRPADQRTQAVAIKHNSVGTQAGRIAGELIELGKEIKQ